MPIKSRRYHKKNNKSRGTRKNNKSRGTRKNKTTRRYKKQMRGGIFFYQLEKMLTPFGPKEQVESTIQRIKNKNNWDDFLHNYPYGTLLNPHAIKQIVTNYYKDRPTPTNEHTFNALAHEMRVNM